MPSQGPQPSPALDPRERRSVLRDRAAAVTERTHSSALTVSRSPPETELRKPSQAEICGRAGILRERYSLEW